MAGVTNYRNVLKYLRLEEWWCGCRRVIIPPRMLGVCRFYNLFAPKGKMSVRRPCSHRTAEAAGHIESFLRDKHLWNRQ